MAPQSRRPPVTGGRNETKRNETKRKKTKNNERKHRRSQYRSPHPVPRYGGPGLPTRPGPVRSDWAWRSQAAGPDPAAAKRDSPVRTKECRTGCGELGRPTDWPVAGIFAGALAQGPGVQRDAEWVSYVYVAWLQPGRDGGDAVSCRRLRGGGGEPPLRYAFWAAGGTYGAVLLVRGGRAGGAAHVGPCWGRTESCAGRGQRGALGRGSLPTYTCLALGGAAAAAAALCGDPDPGAPSPRPPGGCRTGGALCGKAASPSAVLIHCYFWPGGRSRAGGRLYLPLSPMARPPPAPPCRDVPARGRGGSRAFGCPCRSCNKTQTPSAELMEAT